MRDAGAKSLSDELLANVHALPHGEKINHENQGGQPNIGFWDNAQEWVSWKVNFKAAGKFRVTASCAAASSPPWPAPPAPARPRCSTSSAASTSPPPAA